MKLSPVRSHGADVNGHDLGSPFKITYSDEPGAFTVGFVVTGESFTGHDARVRDQVASAVEDGPG